MNDKLRALDVNALAQEIRRVNGSNSLGAGGLAEVLAPYIESLLPPSEAGEGDKWKPSGNDDYDRNIHMNPDARAWADFFVATFPGQAERHDLMVGWFANAMMAMHDHLKSTATPPAAEVDDAMVWRAIRAHREADNAHFESGNIRSCQFDSMRAALTAALRPFTEENAK